jgi:hypothetical protein
LNEQALRNSRNKIDRFQLSLNAHDQVGHTHREKESEMRVAHGWAAAAFVLLVVFIADGLQHAQARVSGNSQGDAAYQRLTGPQPVVTVCRLHHPDPSSSISNKPRGCSFVRVSDALLLAKPHSIIVVEQGHYIEEPCGRHHATVAASAAFHSLEDPEDDEHSDWIRVRANNVTLVYVSSLLSVSLAVTFSVSTLVLLISFPCAYVDYVNAELRATSCCSSRPS